MLKYLLLAIVIYVAWRIWQARQRADAAAAAPEPAVEAMVACARCGVHLPVSEALVAGDGRAYCCAAHRDAAGRQ